MLEHPPGNADVERRAPAVDLLVVGIGSEAAVQLVRVLINEADLHRVVVDDLLEQRRDLAEERALVQRGEERGARLDHGVPQVELRLECRRGVLELLVLAGVLDGDRRVRREHLERFDQLERGQGAVGRIVEVEDAHQLALLVEERHEQIVARMPLPGATWPEVQLRKVVELLLGPLVLAVIDEVGRADLVLLEEELVPDLGRDGAVEELAIVLGVLADCGTDAELPGAGIGEIHGGLAEPEGIAQRHRDDMHDGVQFQARLQLVGEADESAQQLDLAALGSATVLHSERHPLPHSPWSHL